MEHNFQLIFTESIEKYVYLRLKIDTLKEILKLHKFTAENEYYIIKGIKAWVIYDLYNRITYAETLFSYVNCKSCSKTLMLENEEIDTGNSQLDYIIQQLHLKISIINDSTLTKLLNLYKLDTMSFKIKHVI